jgi:hypothetical protein
VEIAVDGVVGDAVLGDRDADRDACAGAGAAADADRDRPAGCGDERAVDGGDVDRRGVGDRAVDDQRAVFAISFLE